jgi:multicomponent Na+:H+ antiporter subunit C
MTLLLALAIGVLFACGTYLLLQRNLARLIFGVALLGQGANLVVFTTAGLVRARPPLIDPQATAPPSGAADPLPQALVLTAIVIGFGLVAFTAALAMAMHAAAGTDDPDELRSTDT